MEMVSLLYSNGAWGNLEKEIKENCQCRQMGWLYAQKVIWRKGKLEKVDDFTFTCASGDCVADCSRHPLKGK